jgi:Ca2+-binding EF-hand superfamily protein
VFQGDRFIQSLHDHVLTRSSCGCTHHESKKQRQVRSAFDELDPENNGFIPMTSFNALMAKIDATQVPAGTQIDAVKRRLDPDNLGIILYEKVVSILEEWAKQKAMAAAQASMPHTPFDCQGQCGWIEIKN